jgi:hypothetical protein
VYVHLKEIVVEAPIAMEESKRAKREVVKEDIVVE